MGDMESSATLLEHRRNRRGEEKTTATDGPLIGHQLFGCVLFLSPASFFFCVGRMSVLLITPHPQYRCSRFTSTCSFHFSFHSDPPSSVSFILLITVPRPLLQSD